MGTWPLEAGLAADGPVMSPICLCSDDLSQTAMTWYLNTATSSERLSSGSAPSCVAPRWGGFLREDIEAQLLFKGRA